MEDIITQALRQQCGKYEVLELENRSLQRLEEMLLYDIIRLREIPQNIRVSNKTLYIYAFRAAVSSTKRYEEELKLFQSDIRRLKNKTEELAALYKDMEYWIKRCWDHHDNAEKEKIKNDHSTAGGEYKKDENRN